MAEALVNSPVVNTLLHGLNTLTNVAGAGLSTLGKGIGLDEAAAVDGLNPIGLGLVTEDAAKGQAFSALSDASWNQGVETEQMGVFFKKPSLLLMLMPIITATFIVTVISIVRTFVMVNIGQGPKETFPTIFKDKEEEYYPAEYYPEEPPKPLEDIKDSKESYRKRRDVSKNNTTSATPTLTLDQVNSLTSVVTTALNTEECLHRLLCEAGAWAKDAPAIQSISDFVQIFLPQHLLSPFKVFKSGEKCERFSCGQLPVKK